MVDGELVYYFTDHLGGTNVVSDYDGAQIELDEYLPYGEFSRRVRSSEKVTNYFTGQKLDDESGLYYYGARYYDPAIGRFITPDTIVQNPFDPQTLNRYSYCGNNPVNCIDPDGHSFWKKLGRAFSNSWGSFVGGQIGGILGSFTPFGAMGSFVLGNIGSAVGSATQHGGNVGAAIGASFQDAALSGAGYWVGHQIGGAISEGMGRMMGMVGSLAASTKGEIFQMSGEDIMVQATVSAVYMGVSAGINYAVDNIRNGPSKEVAKCNNVNTSPQEKAVLAERIQEKANTPADYSALSADSIQDVTLQDLFSVAGIVAAAGESVALVKGLHALSANLAGKLATNGGFARVGNSLVNKMVTDVANKLKMTPIQRREFGSYIEAVKDGVRGGADNYRFKQILEIGKEFLNLYGK